MQRRTEKEPNIRLQGKGKSWKRRFRDEKRDNEIYRLPDHRGLTKFWCSYGAPIAQLDRASDYGSEGSRFNSWWVHQPSLLHHKQYPSLKPLDDRRLRRLSIKATVGRRDSAQASGDDGLPRTSNKATAWQVRSSLWVAESPSGVEMTDRQVLRSIGRGYGCHACSYAHHPSV